MSTPPTHAREHATQARGEPIQMHGDATRADRRVPTERSANLSTLTRAELPELHATWRVRLVGRGGGPGRAQMWHLRRGADRIVWTKGAVDEVWTRSASGIAMQRLMHPQRHVIDYSPGELRALEVEADWRELGMLFAERDLAHLRRVAHRTLAAGQTRWRGTLNGEEVDLVWDTRTRLPVSLEQLGRHGRVRWQLERLVAGPAAAASGAIDACCADYARIDAADFGDMDRDPVVRLAQAHDESRGWRRAHGH